MNADPRLQILSDSLRAFADATSDYNQLLDVIARTVADAVADGCVVRLLDDGWLAPVAFHLPFESNVADPAASHR